MIAEPGRSAEPLPVMGEGWVTSSWVADPSPPKNKKRAPSPSSVLISPQSTNGRAAIKQLRIACWPGSPAGDQAEELGLVDAPQSASGGLGQRLGGIAAQPFEISLQVGAEQDLAPGPPPRRNRCRSSAGAGGVAGGLFPCR